MCVSELWTFWFWHFFPFLYASFQKLLNSIEDVGREHFSGDATDFQLDLRLDLDLVFTKHKTYFFKPFLCSFCPMLWLIDLLEHTHCFNPIYRCLTDWNRFSSTICLFGFIYVACNGNILWGSPCWRATLQHDATTTIVDHRNGVVLNLVCTKDYTLAFDEITQL